MLNLRQSRGEHQALGRNASRPGLAREIGFYRGVGFIEPQHALRHRAQQRSSRIQMSKKMG
jgi:hypothetical protein